MFVLDLDTIVDSSNLGYIILTKTQHLNQNK